MDFFLLFLFLFFIFSVLLSIESVCMHMIIWCASVCVVHIIMCDAQTSTGRMHHGDKQQLYSWNWKTCSHMQILWPNQTRHRKKKKTKRNHHIESNYYDFFCCCLLPWRNRHDVFIVIGWVGDIQQHLHLQSTCLFQRISYFQRGSINIDYTYDKLYTPALSFCLPKRLQVGHSRAKALYLSCRRRLLLN